MPSMVATLEIDEDLLTTAEQTASEQGQTLSAFVEKALRAACAQVGSRGEAASLPPPRQDSRNGKRVELPTFRGQGLRPGVNLNDSAGLLELMEL
jgi:Arc/MetJ family transcription regulator